MTTSTTCMPAHPRSADSPSTSNDRPGVTMSHSNGTDDLAADSLFSETLADIEVMVRNAAEKSMPKSKFLPKFELAWWDEDERATIAANFDRKLEARMEAIVDARMTALLNQFVADPQGQRRAA